MDKKKKDAVERFDPELLEIIISIPVSVATTVLVVLVLSRFITL